MKQSKLPKQALIILGIALVLVISTVMWSSAQITQDTEEEVQSTLRDVATQNALIVQQELRENFNLLYSLADAISVSPDAVNAKSDRFRLTGRSGDKHRWLCTGSVQQRFF